MTPLARWLGSLVLGKPDDLDRSSPVLLASSNESNLALGYGILIIPSGLLLLPLSLVLHQLGWRTSDLAFRVIFTPVILCLAGMVAHTLLFVLIVFAQRTRSTPAPLRWPSGWFDLVLFVVATPIWIIA